MSTLAKQSLGKRSKSNSVASGSAPASPAAFDNDADFISFDDDTMPSENGMGFPVAIHDNDRASASLAIKGKGKGNGKGKDKQLDYGEADMDLDDSDSSNNGRLPAGITIRRGLDGSNAPNAQEQAISATHVLPADGSNRLIHSLPARPYANSDHLPTNHLPSNLPPRPHTNSGYGPTYTGGYDSPTGLNIRGSSSKNPKPPILSQPPPPPNTMPPPSPPPKPSKSEEKEKKAKKERKKERRAAQAKEQAAENKKRKHIVFDHDDYSDSGAQAPPTSDGEYLPWVSQVNWFDEEEGGPAGVVKLLNQEAKAAADWLAPTPIEHETRSMIVSRIIQCVKEAFPEAKGMRIQSFGSNENELYLPGGDIDIVIIRESVPFQIANRIQNMFRKIINALTKAGLAPAGPFRDVGISMIIQAKCPIIKFTTVQGSIAVDISLYDEGGIKTAAIVKEYISEYPAARELLLLVKAYMRRAKVNEVFTGGLGSYSTFILVISFLQLHPEIMNNAIRPEINIGTLLTDFFTGYAQDFDWATFGISLRNGGRHFRKNDRGWSYAHNSIENIALEDPQDSSNNVSKGSTDVNRIFRAWTSAMNTLNANYDRQTYAWREYNETGEVPYEWTNKRGKLDKTRMSFLKGIVGFQQIVLDKRRRLEDLFFTGDLQRHLGLSPPPSSREEFYRLAKKQEESREQVTEEKDDERRSYDKKQMADEDNFGAIHMNADPRQQILSDDSDDEPTALDRLARNRPVINKPGSNKSRKTKRERQGLADQMIESSSAAKRGTKRSAPSRGSKEAEMGIYDDEDAEGGMGRPIDIDDYEDGFEILDGRKGKSAAQTIRYEDTLPEPSASSEGPFPVGSRSSSSRSNARHRQEYWASKGPRDLTPELVNKRSRNSKRASKPEGRPETEDYSNVSAQRSDAIDDNADFVSFNDL